MATLSLIESHIRAGAWQGLILTALPDGGTPKIEVSHRGKALDGLRIEAVDPEEGRWVASVSIPAEVLYDGIQVFLLRDLERDEILGHFSILAGESIAQDALAEIELLRAELDLLKSAFRRHCLESEAKTTAS